jgi:acetyl esterase/lipase
MPDCWIDPRPSFLERLKTECSALALFNRLVPKDRGATLALRDLAYGRHARQRLDIYLPAGTAALASAPLVVFFYGGSWNSGRKEDYRFVGRALAARGFVVAIPDYRLVPEVRFPDFLVDGGRALEAFRGITRDRFGNAGPLLLAGHSAGAYNVVMLALDTGIAERAGYAREAIAGVVGLSGPYDFLPLRLPVTQAAFAAADDLAATQPIHHAGNVAPPMLLLTGVEDDLVLLRNAECLARALGEAGNTVERRSYPGLGHAGTLVALARPFRRRAPVLDDITGWCRTIASNTVPDSPEAIAWPERTTCPSCLEVA